MARITTRRFKTVSRSARGFTLIEVLIVAAIVAILSTIAYSSYQDSIVRTRRSAAQGCLLENAQFMERFYNTNLRYDQTVPGGAAPPAPVCSSGRDVTDSYTVSFLAGTPTATTYTLRAVPKAGQAARDTRCATLGVDQAGNKTKSGTGTLDECW
jgi:type IV pilus assembly protein PilE